MQFGIHPNVEFVVEREQTAGKTCDNEKGRHRETDPAVQPDPGAPLAQGGKAGSKPRRSRRLCAALHDVTASLRKSS